MSKKIVFAYWYFSFFCPFVLFAGHHNIFRKGDTDIPCYYDILDYRTANIGINEILADSSLPYYELADLSKKSIPGHMYWLRFTITNVSSEQLLIQGTKFERTFTLYYPDTDGSYIAKKQNYNTPFFNKDLYGMEVVHTIPYTDKQTTYYLQIQSDFYNGLGCRISTVAACANKNFLSICFHTFIFGCIFLVLIAVSLLYVKLKERIYLYYACYLAGALLYILISFGITIPLYRLHTWDFLWYNLHYKIFITFQILYSREFLNTKTKYQLLDTFILYSIYVRIALFLVNYFVRIPLAEEVLIDIVTLFPLVYIAYQEVRAGQKFVSWYLISITFMISCLIFDGYIHHWGQSGLFIVFSYKFYFATFSILAEIVLFTYALSERFRNLKNAREHEHLKTIASQKLLLDIAFENEKLKDKLNSELGQMVAQQTLDLRRANHQLQLYADQVGELNQVLKTDNEKLIHDVELLTKARVIENNIGYREFQKTFPDEDTSLKFIADLKNAKGYKCKKCGYKNKYNVGKQLYSRKCPICKYTETVTGYTLLENIKFSPQKALFIVYKLFSTRNPNLNQISEELQLRKGTCYSFAEKVTAALEEHRHHKGDKQDWSEFILASMADTDKHQLPKN